MKQEGVRLRRVYALTIVFLIVFLVAPVSPISLVLAGTKHYTQLNSVDWTIESGRNHDYYWNPHKYGLVNGTIIADDEQTSFWTVGTWGSGSVGTPTLSDDESVKVNGTDSLNITVGSGSNEGWYLYHDYGSPMNWTSQGKVRFWFYGQDSDDWFVIMFQTSSGNYFDYSFVDDFSGWLHITIPLSNFTSHGSPAWGSIEEVQINSVQATENIWHFDYFIIGNINIWSITFTDKAIMNLTTDSDTAGHIACGSWWTTWRYTSGEKFNLNISSVYVDVDLKVISVNYESDSWLRVAIASAVQMVNGTVLYTELDVYDSPYVMSQAQGNIIYQGGNTYEIKVDDIPLNQLKHYHWNLTDYIYDAWTIEAIDGRLESVYCVIETQYDSTSALVEVDNLQLTIFAETVQDTLNPTKDSYVSQILATTNYGSESDLRVQSLTGYLKRSLAEFNIAAYQPANISDVTLRLYASTAEASGRNYTISRVTGSWAETSVNWNNQPSVTGSVTASAPTGVGWWSVNVTSLWTAQPTLGFRISDNSEGSGTTGTLGYTSIGGADSADTVDVIRGSLFTSPNQTVYVKSISVAVRSLTAHSAWGKAAIYRHSDLALIASSAETSIAIPTTADWRTLTFTSLATLTASTEYVLVIWFQSGGYVIYVRYGSGSANQGHYQSLTYTGTFPDPLVPTHDNNQYSIYATYYTTTDQTIFDSREGTNPPELVITYTYEDTYSFNQSRYENNTAISSLTATAHYSDASSTSFTITEDIEYMKFSGHVLYFAWLVSGNTYRTYYPVAVNETITFYQPDATWALYEFTPRDYAGITSGEAYVTTYHIIGGSLQPVERRDIHEVVNTLPFVMVVGGSYKMVLTTDSLEYVFGWFFAGSQLSQDLIIRNIAFSEKMKLAYRYIIHEAWRVENNTVIYVHYQDLQNHSVSATLYITYRNGTVAHTDNSTEQDVTWVWDETDPDGGPDPETDYTVTVDSEHSNPFSTSWSYGLPAVPSISSVFDLSMLGAWPIQNNQVFGIALVLAVACVFSTLTAGTGIVLTVLTAGILRYLGWLDIDMTVLAVAGSFAVIYAIVEAKKRL